MLNTPTEETLNQLPGLYDTEFIALPDKLIHIHFFIGGDCDWYICEYDKENLFFAFCILNGDLQNAEWGYVDFSELKAIKVGGWLEVNNDLYWDIRPALEVEKIRRAHNWPMPNLVSKRLDNITA